MIHFVAASGSPETIERLQPQLMPALQATKVHGGRQRQLTAPGGQWALAAISPPDVVSEVRVGHDRDTVIAFNGTALCASGRQTELHHTLLDAFRRDGSAGVVHSLGGSYNFVGISPDHGLHAFPDFSGLYPVYAAEGTGFAVVSNRSTTIAELIDSPGWDEQALAWIVGHGSLFDTAMPQRDVRHVPPGTEAVAAYGSGTLTVQRGAPWIWPDADSDDEGRPNLSEPEWQAVTDSLVANYRALGQMGGEVRISLTGGKDSRLCLALAKAAGLQDRIHCITAGPHDSPEVEVSRQVAAAAEVSHERIGPPADRDTSAAEKPSRRRSGPPDDFDAERVWLNLRRNTYRYEGIVSAWSGLMNPARPPVFNVKGFGGEFYRRGNTRQRVTEHLSVDELADSFVHFQQRHDPLRILTPEVAERQTAWLRDWVYDHAKGFRLDLLSEKAYVDYRLSHWTGVLVQNTPLRVNVNPLLSHFAVQKNLELSVGARGSERFHYEVMRHAAPELVAVPFLKDVWAEEIRSSAAIELPDEPFPVTVTPRHRQNWSNPGWDFVQHEAKEIERLFHRAKARTVFGEICNVPRLKRLARNPDQLGRAVQMKEYFGAVGAAMALLDRTERIVDTPQRRQ